MLTAGVSGNLPGLPETPLLTKVRSSLFRPTLAATVRHRVHFLRNTSYLNLTWPQTAPLI